MPIIIDGWNLIRNHRSEIDDTERDSLDAAAELISEMERFQSSRGDPVILVFDSTNEFLGLGHTNTPKLKVVAANDADKYIKKYIDDMPERQRKNLKVVSSDKEVFYHAKGACAEPVKSEEFWKKLRR